MHNFLTRFAQSKPSCLVVFVLINAAVILGVNLLFQVPLLKSFLENKLWFISFGVCIYGLWLMFIFGFFKKAGLKFQKLTLTSIHLKQALIGAFLLFLLVNALFLFFAHNIGNGYVLSAAFDGCSATLKSIATFIFNILPGAFIEEITFRAFLLPQFYLLLNSRIRNSLVSIILAILISTLIFCVSHIPRDLLRFEFSLINFWNNSVYLFINSIIYSLLFLLSRNIWFTVFCHAFFNFSVVIIASGSSSGFFTLVLGISLALLWRRMFPVKPLP